MEIANTRLEELEQLISELEAVPHGEHVVRWADIPAHAQPDIQRFLYGSAAPLDGIFRWDYERYVLQIARQIAVLRVPAVTEEPDCLLEQWNVYMIPNKGSFLVGKLVNAEEHRRTSFIVSFNLESMVVTTGSGRRYHLIGAPMRSESVEVAFDLNVFRELNALTSWV